MSATGGFDLDAASDAALAGLSTFWAKPKRSQTITLSVIACRHGRGSIR
jgi:hypothetical protein